jgi:uncharacterized protein (DUF2147 family)
MKQKWFLSLVVFFGAGVISLLSAQSPVGMWRTIDDKTGKPKSHVEIYMENGELKGRVKKLLLKPETTLCEKCEGNLKNKRVVGMDVIRGLKKDGKEYAGGTIIDPENGKEYRCSLWLEGDDKLVVRGYIGISLIGRSQTWERIRS